MTQPIIDVIIPVYNEQDAIGSVIRDIPHDLVRKIIVCNNGSTDQTALIAKGAGGTVVEQQKRGYGNACLEGMAYIEASAIKPDIVVFLDGDYSDHPEEMHLLIEAIQKGNDLVIGSRAKGRMEKGAMMPQQIFGNWLATTLIKLIYGYHFTDLGPFRAIKYESLCDLHMEDQTYGWTVEMQVKAAKLKLKCDEVPVSYRRRVGESKVSGTLKGTILAGQKIIWTIFKYM
jgi:glycosyltransferase involved in cell wall biosynthesis